MQWCEGLLSEYLLCIFERLNWVSLQTMMASGLYDEVSSPTNDQQSTINAARYITYFEVYM